MEKEANTIDTAILTCNDKINIHRNLASRFLTIIITLSLLFIASLASKVFVETRKTYAIEKVFLHYQNDLYNSSKLYKPYAKDTTSSEYRQYRTTNDSINNLKSNLEKPSTGAYDLILYGIFILMFSIITSFYRFHQKEVSKFEQYLIGFHRIRIAANNSEKGFDDEVRISLARDAFSYETNKGLFTKERKVESPIPGHPTSDIATLMINRIFDAIDIKERKSKRNE